MSNDIIQAQYEILEELAGRFGNEAAVHEAMRGRIADQVDGLRNGGWEGEGSAAFFQEIDHVILPAVDRLHHAMTEAQSATLLIRQIIYAAEEDAVNQFQEMGRTNVPLGGAVGIGKMGGLSGSANVGASISGATANIGSSGGFLKNAGDFVSGMWAEGKDMVSGLYNMVRHPIQTAQGIWYAINNPGEAWDAIKKPFVDDWNNGRPWRAIGRGTMAILTTIVGAKGVDKLGKVAKGAGAVDDLGRAGSLADDAGRVGSIADDAGRVGSVSDDAGRAGSVVDDVGNKADDAARAAEAAKQNARRLDNLDNGHSIARHGPEITDDALKHRITNGVAPDGKISPTRSSTRFDSYDDWIDTRQKAFDNLNDNGIDLTQPPKPGDPTSHVVEIQHGNSIGSGFKSTEPKRMIPNPTGSGNSVRVYDNPLPINDLKWTRTKVAWNQQAGKWEVVQHFPIPNP